MCRRLADVEGGLGGFSVGKTQEPRSQIERIPGLSRETKKQNIAVWVSKLEASQAVVCILEWRTENRAVIDKFTGKSIRIWGIDIGPHREVSAAGVFWSNDVPKCYKELSARGVEFLGPPKTEARGTSAMFRHLAGNQFLRSSK